MKYKIVADSGCDLNEELKSEMGVALVPLTINLGGKEYRDDSSLDVDEMLRDMDASQDYPKTSSPSPQDFIDAYEGDERVFVVTLSSKVSGTFGSAMMAKKMYLEEKCDKFIHVFDSLTASVGETLISMKIFDLIKQNIEELEIVERVNKYIKEMKTLFLIESLDNLIKAGRIGKFVGKMASALSIKPIMGGNEDGEIELIEKNRGSQRAFRRLVEIIGEIGENLEEKILGIAHCNCLQRAQKFREEVLKRYNFKDIVIVKMSGLSSVYANKGGIVIAF